MMNLMQLIKKNKKLHYLCKALKHIGDADYVDFYLEMESDPRTLLFKKYGEQNISKAIYAIPQNGNNWGFFAEFRALLCKLYYADRMGFTPYVQWGKEFLYYDSQKEPNEENAFEYYFRQPANISHTEIFDSYMVCWAKPAEAIMIEREYKQQDYYGISPEMEEKLAQIYRKYIILNDKTKNSIIEDMKKLGDFTNMLGIHFRGTDYQVGYNNHPVYIPVQEIIEKAKLICQKENYNKIFLATDDINALKSFIEAFSADQILYYPDVYRGATSKSVALSKESRKYHHYLLGYEVLRDMISLSQCQGLLSGVSQVTNCARIAKRATREHYQSQDIIYHGVNHNNKMFS